MDRLAQLNRCVEVYSQSDWAGGESIDQARGDALFSQDVEAAARFATFAFNEIYELAASYSAEGINDSEFDTFENSVSRVKNLLQSLARVNLLYERVEQPIRDFGKLNLKLEEIGVLAENLQTVGSAEERRDCLEDFVDLVDSDAVTSDPNEESIPWQRSTAA
jgi:hypothetical protein